MAKLAEVSIKTVSRVINNESAVRQETRDRVNRAIDELGYSPHSGARSLRGRCRNCIGVTLGVPALEVPISEELLLWLFAELYHLFGEKGTYICFDLNPHEAGPNVDYARGLWEQLYGGIINIAPLAVDDTVIQRVHDSGLPYLVSSRLASLPECSSATVDFEEAAYISAKHMIARGHRRIAMLKAFHGYQGGVERRVGYLRALEEAGIAPDEALIGRAGFFRSSGVADKTHRLLLNPGVTALLDCSAKEDGDGVREGVRRAGRVIGSDLEVLSWTYADNAAVLAEACAHVWIPLREAITEGLQQFADWFAGERDGPVNVLYKPTLNETVELGEVPKPRHIFARTD